jgi:transposase InsO family protein
MAAWMNIKVACQLLKVNRSAYYNWRRLIKDASGPTNHNLEQAIVKAFDDSRKTYGARRILIKLNQLGLAVGIKKIRTIMRSLRLQVVCRKKFKATTNSQHNLPVFENVLTRNFAVSQPNKAWVCDITYLATNEGWYYLAVVVDLFSRKVVGFKLGERMTKELVISAQHLAMKSRGYPCGVIVHSDRGSQYASHEYRRLLTSLGLIGSMSKKGDCYDNAVAESFFATFKKECIYQTRLETRTKAHLYSFDYIEGWYNSQRSHSKLGNMSPTEFEAKYEQIIVTCPVLVQAKAVQT